MNWYGNQKERWIEIIKAVAAEEKRSLQMVEKDTIQSIFLLKLSYSELPFVFKGGTSLSKVYDLIKRFSEDIDLSMSRKITESEKKSASYTIIKIASSMGLFHANEKDIRSGYNYNKYVFEYESLFSSMQSEIIVETSFYQISYPVETLKVNSIVEKFCQKNGIDIREIEKLNCNIKVQNLSRTFIDKIFAICDYTLLDSIDRNSRHLYDISKMIPYIKFDSKFCDLVIDVRRDRMLSKNNPSAQIENDIPQILERIIEKRIFESDYNNITNKLLYENMTYDEAIKEGVEIVLKMKVF